MSTRFTRAILRPPGASYTAGITTSTEGAPSVALALAQHAAYAQALAGLGLALTMLPADEAHPDSTFVEDTAILSAGAAIVTRPGAASRAGETTAIAAALTPLFPAIHRIAATGTVDGGDICETDDLILIGITERTNPEGARQLAAILAALGQRAELVDIRAIPGLLHLKTGISWLGEGRMAVAPGLPDLPALRRFECVTLEPAEAYAANCIRVNGRVLVAAGYPRFAERLSRLGYTPLPLEMSEFRRMDGGLSCLSLRF